MGKTEEDWNGLKFGFLKTVQPNSFSKLIPAACSFKNAQKTYLFVSDLWFCYLHVISLLTLSSIVIEGVLLAKLNKMNWTAVTQSLYAVIHNITIAITKDAYMIAKTF